MKRILTLLMAVSLLLCLAACGKPTGSPPEQTPQQTESSDPPDQTEPPALEGEALSILPAEDAGLTEGGYDAYREEDPMAEIVLLPTRSVTDFHYFIVGFREDGEQLTLTREDDLYTADALSPDRPLLLAIPIVETIPNRGVSYVDADGGEWKLELRNDGLFTITDPDGKPHTGEGWSTAADGSVHCGPTDIYFAPFAFNGGCSRWKISGNTCTPLERA